MRSLPVRGYMVGFPRFRTLEKADMRSRPPGQSHLSVFADGGMVNVQRENVDPRNGISLQG